MEEMWPTNISCLSVSCSKKRGCVVCVCGQEERGEMRRHEHVCGCEYTQVHIHVWLGRCYLSASQSYSTRWTHIGQRPQMCQGAQAQLTWFSCLTVLWEAVPSESWTQSVQLLNPWSLDISGTHQVTVPVSSEHWAELQPWEWMPNLMGGSLWSVAAQRRGSTKDLGYGLLVKVKRSALRLFRAVTRSPWTQWCKPNSKLKPCSKELEFICGF